MTIVLVSKCSLDIEQYVGFKMSVLISPSKSLIRSRWVTYTGSRTNETGLLPLCTFSVMGLSMCSSIFSESSPVRSKSGIINELSGLPNSVPTV